MTAEANEFWGVPIPIWNLGATLLLTLVTAVYVVLTRRVATGAETAALAALASVEIQLEAKLFTTPRELHVAPIVQLKNDGATLYVHGARITSMFGDAELNGEPIEWEERSPFDLGPVESWGPFPWHLHKGESRTFYWPDDAPVPKPPMAFVTVAVRYSVGRAGEQSIVQLSLDLSHLPNE